MPRLAEISLNSSIMALFSIFLLFLRLVTTNSLQPHGLQPTKLLCPWGFSRQKYWSGLPCPPPGDLPNPEIELRSPALQQTLYHLSHQGNLDSILKNKNITLPTKICLVKDMVFPVVMYRCENWTIKKAEYWRIDALLWCWRRPLRVPWTSRRSNQSILKEINSEYSLEGLILKLKLQ